MSALPARGELWWCELPGRSAVNLDSVESVSIAVLVDRLGRLADVRMREVCTALAVAVACESAVR